ncbi:OLC1v1008546C1 [Oldenlandia corymbosa var. corymbosa]|uniref:OLC1v1008546C1 n=1 Tax=Oldenlandia corymbosa var. corymbosa TaxID=529605 RepID=A0AAV1DPC5_OLDCO|nr:OLC1v1008546C1 [Oldenlandia corymbosa var. corymbosa]
MHGESIPHFFLTCLAVKAIWREWWSKRSFSTTLRSIIKVIPIVLLCEFWKNYYNIVGPVFSSRA